MTDSISITANRERLLSLDIFRGWTIIFMILVNNPGSWAYVYGPLKHADWDGWTPTDLIFPFFIWISGFSISLSFDLKTHMKKRIIFLSVIRRSLILVFLGIFLSAFPFGLLGLHSFQTDHLRFPGVLQRIGICYFISASIYLAGRKKYTSITAILFLSAYGLVVDFFPVPGFGAGILTPEANAARFFDTIIFGKHTWSGSPASGFDPEGFLSTLTSSASMMSGILAYGLLKQKSTRKAASLLFFAGILSIAAGILFHHHWPINKNLWSISYVFFTSGISLSIFAFLYYFYDIKKTKIFIYMPAMYGMNAILVYVLSAIISRILIYSDSGMDASKALSMKSFIFNWTLNHYIHEPFLCSFALAVIFILLFVPVLSILKAGKIHVKI